MHEIFADGAGVPIALRENLRLVLAPNPSPMTGPGTNTYLVGTESLAVIDPGPASDSHLEALMAAIDGRHVSHIIVTHSHLDHSPLADPLSKRVDAPVIAFGDTLTGRSSVMQRLADQGMTGGGEGLDHDFAPDQTVNAGDTITGQDWSLQVLHTPGHLGNHISLVWDDAVFVGDMVMDWSTSLVSPPDGDMTDFLKSCRMLANRSERTFYAGHGAPLVQPQDRVQALIAHRDARTASILDALDKGAATVADLVARIYIDLDPRLRGAAGRNVFAHLVALWDSEQVTAQTDLTPSATFSLR